MRDKHPKAILEKEYRRLSDLQALYYRHAREVEWEDLPKPVKDGWYVYLDLRDDVARRDDADLIRASVRLVRPHPLWVKTKKDPLPYYQRRFRAPDLDFYHLPKIDTKSFDKSGISTKWFSDPFLGPWTYGRRFQYRRCLVPEHSLAPKYKRKWLTKVKKHDNVLEQEIAEIEARLRELENMGIGHHYNYPTKDDRKHGNRRRRVRERAASREILKGDETFDFPPDKMTRSWV